MKPQNFTTEDTETGKQGLSRNFLISKVFLSALSG